MSENLENFEIFPWDKNFETNIELIDEQHKQLVHILNQLAAHLAQRSTSIALNQTFDELVDYTDYHFKTEEKIWAEHFQDDEWRIKHEKTHGSFIEEINHLKNQDSDRPLDDVVQDLVAFLAHWLAHHILDTDKRMSFAVLAIKDGSSIEQAKTYANERMSGETRVLIDTVLNMYDTLSARTLGLMREKSLRQQADAALISSEEARKLEARLRQTEKMEALGNLAGGIAHDLNNLMTPILAMSQLLKKHLPEEEKPHKWVDTIIHSARTASTLVQRMHSLSHRDEQEFIPRDICEVTEEALGILPASVPSRITFESECTPNAGRVNIDSTQYITALMNLVSNAVDAMEEGSGRLSLVLSRQDLDEKQAQAVSLQRAGSYVRVMVADSGVGIEEDALDHAFEPYFSTKDKGEGAGLGLAMVQKFAIEHAGTVTLSSRPGEGTTVDMYLPLCED